MINKSSGINKSTFSKALCVCTVMHPLLLYIVTNTAGNIHRNRVSSAHVSIDLTITGKEGDCSGLLMIRQMIHTLQISVT